jgi:hypothetical protein
MSQTDSYQVPAHPSGLEMRTQLNVIVLALLGDNCGPTEPIEKYPGQMWGDTTAMRLKRRTNANDAWINIGPLDNFLGDIQGQIDSSTAGMVKKTGDTMSGGLTMYGTGVISSPIYFNAGGYAPHFRSNNQLPGFEWINAANNAVIGSLDNNGAFRCAAGFTASWGVSTFNGRILAHYGPGTGASGGEIGISSPEGFHFYIRGKAGAGVEFVNDAYNAVLGKFDNGGNFQCNGEIRAYGAVVAQTDVYATNNLHAGNCTYQTDGNIWMPWAGDYLSNVLGGKAVNGAQVQWNSGISELASAMGGNNVVDASAPWVMEGVRVTTSTDINRIYPRVIWLRNQ